jgi:hypothetical protein
MSYKQLNKLTEHSQKAEDEEEPTRKNHHFSAEADDRLGVGMALSEEGWREHDCQHTLHSKPLGRDSPLVRTDSVRSSGPSRIHGFLGRCAVWCGG